MDWINILNQVFELCIVPLLAIATKVLIDFINTKIEEGKRKTDSELAIKYLSLLNDTVCDCVQATNQTYVEALKNKNAFNAEAQKQALQRTVDAVKLVLSEEAKTYLSHFVGDLDILIKEKIEANIAALK